MTNKNIPSALHIQWKNLWELFILRPGAKRKLCHNNKSSQQGQLRLQLSSRAEKNLTEGKQDSAGSQNLQAGTMDCYSRTMAASAFPASPKASEIAQVWDSQGKCCYTLQRNVPPTTVVSSHKRIISELISGVHSIVCRLLH